jgi:hypothetical protein
MASTFKTFVSDDIANTRTLLHEAIPITGSIVNGVTYDETTPATTNIKTYGHGMFQSVYDYPYQSSSANHIFDMTFGHDALITTQGTYDNNINDLVSESTANLMPTSSADIDKNALFSKRKNIYGQMAQVLVGHDVNGEIRKFDIDGDLTAGDKYNALIFFNFSRLLGKDELKKGTFSLKLNTTADDALDTEHIFITDAGAGSDYRTNSPAGEFAVLKATSGSAADTANGIKAARNNANCGLIFYQAGVVAITPEVFNKFEAYVETPTSAEHGIGFLHTSDCDMNTSSEKMYTVMATRTNDELSLAVRKRIKNISFSNTTELNSTIYFCRVAHNDFNYSSNPTYLENSKVRVKNKSTDAPVSYITTVGLYSARNEMLAVAKLSEPLRKDPTNDMTLRVRLDY